jgi:hypothetical protein
MQSFLLTESLPRRRGISSASMKPCRVRIGFALLSICLAVGSAHAQGIAGSGDDAVFFEAAAAATGDLILDDDFDGQDNGGTSCATARVLTGDTTYAADTVSAPNWMGTFGPVASPSNDVVYMFVAGPNVSGSIIPTASNYPFAMYLIPDCSEAGSQPQPIGATATLGRGIDLAASGVTSGNTYYLAVTGVAAGGPGANGTLNFTTPVSLSATPGF